MSEQKSRSTGGIRSNNVVDAKTTAANAIEKGRRLPYNLWPFKTPRGFFRVFNVLMAVVSLGCMADVEGITQFTEFQYELAAGILSASYNLLWCVVYLFIAHIEERIGYTGSYELFGDIIDFCIVAAGALAGAYRCGARYSVAGLNTYEPTCFRQTGHNIEASVVFLLINWVGMGVQIYWSYRNLIDEPKRLFA